MPEKTFDTNPNPAQDNTQAPTRVLAFDFGASSGRAIMATYTPNATPPLTYQEVHRFENNPITKDGTLCWDFGTLFAEVEKSIALAGAFDSVAFDTWGVDFGLLDEQGKLMANPVHYRDGRTEGMVEKACEKMSLSRLYAYTGIQMISINTFLQLLALKENAPETLQKAKKLLFVPDLFSYCLSGETVCEESIASTSQMFDPSNKAWSKPVFDTFGFSAEQFGRPVKSGSVIGSLLPKYCAQLPEGHTPPKVIAVAGHDTQCAVAALPTNQENVAFLSCGTWSLLGTELDAPILTTQSQQLNLSNECGANGKINYLKNIIGLWVIQECRRVWRENGRNYSYGELEALASEAKPLQFLIDPNDAAFAQPCDMPTAVQDYCTRTGQGKPETVGEITRCIYESLALTYRHALYQLSVVTGKPFTALHLLGGGCQSKLLCQWTANSTGLSVYGGPVEATALGNICIQLVALGVLPNLAAGRDLIAKTETIACYTPTQETDAWNEAYQRLQGVIANK